MRRFGILLPVLVHAVWVSSNQGPATARVVAASQFTVLAGIPPGAAGVPADFSLQTVQQTVSVPLPAKNAASPVALELPGAITLGANAPEVLITVAQGS